MKRQDRVLKLGNIYYGYDSGGNFAGNVYGVEGIAPTMLFTMSRGGGREPMIVERICVRQVGRNPDNPSQRKRGAYVEQTLEPMDNPHICNTITSVQKDNMILEIWDGNRVDKTGDSRGMD